MIKAGTHTVRFVDYAFAEPDEEGKSPFVALTFETPEGDRGTYKRYLSPKSAEYTYKDLQRLGIQPDGSFDVNNEFSIVLEDEEYEGKTITKLRWINNVSKFKKMDVNKVEGHLKSFAAWSRKNPVAHSPTLKKVSNSDFAPGEDFDITAGD